MLKSTVVPAVLLALSATAALPQVPPVVPTPPHHRGGTYQNNHIEYATKSLGELLRWRLSAWREDLPRPPATPTPQVTADAAFIQANATAGVAMQPAATWIGHATVLLQMGGINILTDPIFSERASPLSFVGPQRAQPPGLRLDQLPAVQLVVVSHNHYDHCDLPSLKALNAQPGGPPLFIVPLGVKAWMTDNGIANTVELDWWQTQRVADVEVTLTPVQHWSGRGLTDRMNTLWGGYAFTAPGFSAYFAGDTGYSADFAEVGRRFADGFDLALIPVGAYAPRWFMAQQHVDPPEAVQLMRDVGARQALGIHWGTFQLTDESLDEPPLALARARAAAGLAEDRFFVLAIGETRKLPAR